MSIKLNLTGVLRVTTNVISCCILTYWKMSREKACLGYNVHTRKEVLNNDNGKCVNFGDLETIQIEEKIPFISMLLACLNSKSSSQELE
jgi:hypothetical protein